MCEENVHIGRRMFLLLDYTRLSRRLHTGMHPGPGIMVVYPYDNTEYEPVKLGAYIVEQFEYVVRNGRVRSGAN